MATSLRDPLSRDGACSEVKMERFVVEADRRVVGIAIRVRGGFRFVCSDPDFREMDRKVFPRARALASSVAERAKALRSAAKMLHWAL